MSKGESGKDKSGYFSRRCPNGFDTAENSRNAGIFTSAGPSSSYSSGMAVSNRQLHNFWHPHRCHQPNGHQVASVHHYPGHQVFLQHGPFGNEGNQYRPVGYLPQFHLRFPSHPESQHSPFFNSESRNNGFGYCDPIYFDEQAGNRFEGQAARERGGFKTEQGARPKTSKFPFQKGKIKVFRRKRNHNNSSKSSALEKANDKAKDERLANDPGQAEASELALLSDVKEDEESPFSHAPEAADHLKRAASEEEQGAVGGAGGRHLQDSLSFEAVGPLLAENERLPGCLQDSNLIDEGAICDLDKIFQHQEFSQLHDDTSDDDQSVDLPLEAASEQRLSMSRCSGGLYRNVSDDESESENCSYVYEPQHKHHKEEEQCLTHTHCLCVTAQATKCSPRSQTVSRHKAAGKVAFFQADTSGCNGGTNSDDGEDTGDFIDTDLPFHSKHILSSSDEMENLSSNSDQDEEDKTEDYAGHRQSPRHVTSNDLFSLEPNMQSELEILSISKDNGKCNGSLPSQLQNDSNSLFHVKRNPAKTPNSSGSENGDGSPSGSPPLSCAVFSNSPQLHVCYNSPVSCLDGAAASQLPVECHQKVLEDNSCPPGAESALAPASPTQCYQSNVFCSGAIYSTCNINKSQSSQSPGREHLAVTASSELEPTDACLRPPHTSDFASCSTTADGGTCCPPGYQPSSINNLNVCCHHSHSHLANGFNEDSPGANFSNDESNRHQKVFVKFSVEDKADEGESHSASSCELEDVDRFSFSTRKQDKNSDSGGSEDPLSNDTGDNVDMVLLPMEEEIEPVHHMSTGLCAGGVEDSDDFFSDVQSQLATTGICGANMAHLCDEHQYHCAHEQNSLRNGMPSKEFYELIKTVSTTDSYMRFFDKDGQDVQRQPFAPCDDESSNQNSALGGQSSKTERLKVDRVMIWNEYEAYVMQFKQIAVSACGQTAVLNVLKALKIACEKLAVCKVIQTSLRKEDACIPEYLFSRARAGTTADELMAGVEKLSGGTVGGRFFHFWPPRKVKLLQWLAYWMKRGAIPMATLNLQQGPHSLWQVPDSWHHQMVYGVSHQGLYLTNPLEIVSERSAMKQLCSDSVLMVRRQDIISRFRETTDLGQLLHHPDPRWRTMNVLGQVVNVLREFNMPSVPGYRLQVTSHVSIPASYKAGITLFMRKDKSAWTTLLKAPEIPLEE